MRCHVIFSLSSQEEEGGSPKGSGDADFPVRKFPFRWVLLNESDGRGMSINGTHMLWESMNIRGLCCLLCFDWALPPPCPLCMTVYMHIHTHTILFFGKSTARANRYDSTRTVHTLRPKKKKTLFQHCRGILEQ